MRETIAKGALLLVMIGASAWAQAPNPQPPPRYNIMADGYYAREEKDGDWRVRIVGEIPSLCGAYLLIHDENGKVVYHGVVPHGSYTEEKPFVAKVPRDGIAGDYRIKMVGHQDDKLGVLAPWTDLPREVYGSGGFSTGHDARIKPVFKTPEGVEKMHLGAYKGQLKVYDSKGAVVADTEKTGKLHGKYDNAVEFPVTPDETYTLERKCMYFRSYIPRTCFLAFDESKWFCPSPKLDEVKWWELVK